MIFFLKKIFIFLAMLLVVNIAFKIYLDKLYLNRYYEIDLKKNIYLLADSHGGPIGEFENQEYFNYSFGSDSYVDMLYKFKFLIKKSDIEMLILTADDHLLSPYRDIKNNQSVSSVLNTTFTKQKFNNLIKNNIVLLNPEYGSLIKFHLSSYLRDSKPVKPWHKINKTEKIKAANNRFKDQFNYKNSSLLQLNALQNIIELCRENEIKVVGLKFPLSNEYKTIVKTNKFSPDSIFKESNIHVFNFNENFLDNDTFFRDQDHLNELGGKLLRMALRDSIRALR